MNSPWVVIPTYNERENIQKMIPALFQQNIPNLSVLIVDDSSPDETGEVVKELQSRYPTLHLLTRPKKSGLGHAYVHGFNYAIERGADAIVQMDADFSHDPADVSPLLKALETKPADLVIGSRYISGIRVINWPLRRLILSATANMYAKIVTGIPFEDITGGFKAWRSEVLRSIDLPSIQADGYGFQIVTTYRTWKKKARITEVPIVFTERRAGQSKMSKQIVFEAMWLVWKLRLFG
ncbi:MAG: polyprenol monophosphomannose synthase [Patescibacteria group bacterium]